MEERGILMSASEEKTKENKNRNEDTVAGAFIFLRERHRISFLFFYSLSRFAVASHFYLFAARARMKRERMKPGEFFFLSVSTGVLISSFMARGTERRFAWAEGVTRLFRENLFLISYMRFSLSLVKRLSLGWFLWLAFLCLTSSRLRQLLNKLEKRCALERQTTIGTKTPNIASQKKFLRCLRL